jgi:FkbM family methyltransferase
MRRIKNAINRLRRMSGKIGLVNALKVQGSERFKGSAAVSIRIGNRTIFVRPNTPDIEVTVTSLGDEFEPLGVVLDREYDGLVVDAGGYIGTAAIKLSETFPNAQIVSIEPSTENFEVLIRNIESYKNISAIRAALVPTPKGDVVLSNRGTGQWGYTIVDTPLDNPDSEAIESTPTITLDDIRRQFHEQRIGLLKLDIEGGEKDLFDNGGEALASVNAIFVELHDRIVSGCTDAFLKYSENRLNSNFGGEKYLSAIKSN